MKIELDLPIQPKKIGNQFGYWQKTGWFFSEFGGQSGNWLNQASSTAQPFLGKQQTKSVKMCQIDFQVLILQSK